MSYSAQRLPTFNAAAICPKCAGAEIGTALCVGRYSSMHDPCYDFGWRGVEHLDRWCSRCHYKWLECPLDAARAVVAERGGAAAVTYCIQVTHQGLCHWADVRPDGTIGRPAPVAAWMRGRDARWCTEYWTRRGARVQWIRVD